MREKLKKVICLVLTFAMILTGLTIPGKSVQAEETAGAEAEYKVYPKPHSLVYQAGNLSLPGEMNVIFEAGIDDATKNRLTEAMGVKNITLKVSNQEEPGKVNVRVGIKGSGGAADTYAAEHLSYAGDLFDKVDAYLLAIEDNAITILGKDTDAAFYAVSSLKLILGQAEGTSVRLLQMEDYSIGHYRGFIEGYYGLPWSVDDRISLMKFGGDFKMNIYIFAPKDDPYHNSTWRTLYPEDKLADISKMVAAGAASKCRFAWAIHPFMNQKIDSSNYDESLEVVKAKFQQLYDAGVRQFVISADDAKSDVNVQVKLLNDMSQWVKEHTGTYNLAFVPMIYCTGAANWGYGYTLQQYYDLLKSVDADVEFMWTGESVCYPATQQTADHFKQVSGREAFLWLNWPVNDVNHKRLVMGPAENCILNTGITGFKGLVSNPLEQGEASKTSLFAIADFAWNTKDFDAETSWADSFQYIDAGAPEALHELCRHMTNPKPGGITGMAESKEIAPFVNAFKADYNAGNDLSESGNVLAEQLQKIVDAADDFQANGTNENLKDEMRPWVNSLRAISKAGVGYVRAAMALQNEDDDAAWANYCVAVNEYKVSKNCEAPQLNDATILVEAGAEVLMPFAAFMDNGLKGSMEEVLHHTFGNSTAGGGGTAQVASLIYNGLGGFHEGNAGKVTDGDEASYAWFDESAAANSYIGLDLGDVYRIDSVKVLQGKDASHGDIFGSAILEYSTDGENYTPIETITNTNDIQKDLSSLGIVGRYIRIRTAGATNKWFAIREFAAYTSSPELPVYTNAKALESMTAGITQKAAAVNVTEDPITLEAGEYIGIQLPKIREVTSVSAAYDPKDGLTLEASLDAGEWSEVTDFDAVTDMAYLRIRNKDTKPVTFTLSELSLTNSDRDTRFLSTVDTEVGYDPAYAADNSLTTAYMAKDGTGTGSLTWRISDSEQVGSVYILTHPEKDTDAVVSVQDNTGAWHEKGALDKNLNIFTDLESYTSIKSVKVSWTTSSPRIQEMYTTEPRTFGVTLNKNSSLLGIGKAIKLKASVLVLAGEDSAVTWSTSDPNVAAVDESGTVTGVALGNATITASVENGKYTADCSIVVSDRTDPAELNIAGVSAGSQEIANATASEGPAALAIDGKTDTKWHSLWDGDTMENLWISLDLGDVCDVTGLSYLPRQDVSNNGTILGYKIFVSLDGKEWLQADEGSWTNDKEWKSTNIATTIPARYVKLVADSASTDKDEAFASAAEIKLLGFDHDENLVDKRYAIAAGFESEITPADKYTKASYRAYTDARKALKEIVTNVVATQKQVDDAAAAYRGAIQNLKIRVTKVVVSPSELAMQVGGTETLSAQVQPADAGDKTVTWNSDKPDVASVEDNGTVTAWKAGTAVITAASADGEQTGTCTVTVAKKTIPVTGIEVTGAPKEAITVGDTVKLTANVQPSDADNQKVIWSSDKTAVAKVDQNGNLTAVGAGEAKITAATEDGGFAKSVTVTVKAKTIPELTYTVRFDANGGTAVTSTLTVKNQGKYGKLPTTARSGYKFLGWYYGQTKMLEGAVCSLNADATFTAKWEKLTAPSPKLPAQVKGVAKKSPSTSTITVYWKKADGAKSYILERYDAASKKWRVAARTSGTQVKDKKRQAGTHYKYRVTAVNDAGKGKTSSSISAATKPKATKLTKVTQKKGTRKVTLTWRKIKADGYAVYMRTGKGDYRRIKSIEAVRLTRSNLKKKTKYSFRVRSYVKVSGKRIYGSYSNIKRLTIR